MAIKKDHRNYRQHNDRNMQMIAKSLKECGAGRSILIDNSDEIIAGNGCFEQAQKLGIPIKVIESDGSELVAIKRTDLSDDDQKRKQLAIMDNSTTDLSEFDMDALVADFTDETLVDFGVLDTSVLDLNASKDKLTLDDVLEGSKKNTDINEAFEDMMKRNADKDDYGFMLCLTFQSYEQKMEFLSKIGNPKTKYGMYADGQTIALSMGINITPNTMKPFEAQIEKRLSDMAMD
jgi:hypothetical protein